jgi:hypothetical protein
MSKEKRIGLKLMGSTHEDFEIISAHLQDSIVTIRDIVFLKSNKTFLMIVNRFMWEDMEKGLYRENRRIRCAVKFESVLKVQTKNINQRNKNKPLECLAFKCPSNPKNSYIINIFFAGNGIITIICESIDVIMEDLGKSWEVKKAPLHKI